MSIGLNGPAGFELVRFIFRQNSRQPTIDDNALRQPDRCDREDPQPVIGPNREECFGGQENSAQLTGQARIGRHDGGSMRLCQTPKCGIVYGTGRAFLRGCGAKRLLRWNICKERPRRPYGAAKRFNKQEGLVK
jgi:hypothetical protein